MVITGGVRRLNVFKIMVSRHNVGMVLREYTPKDWGRKGVDPTTNFANRIGFSDLDVNTMRVVASLDVGGVIGTAIFLIDKDQGREGYFLARTSDFPDNLRRQVLSSGLEVQTYVSNSALDWGRAFLKERPQLFEAKDRFIDQSLGNKFIVQPFSHISQIDWAHLPFALNPSRAMFFSKISKGGDWQRTTVSLADAIYPFQEFPINPAAVALNYGQESFEGMKAFRQEDGSIVLFRPRDNLSRLARTAARLAMTPIPVDFGLAAVIMTVLANEDFVPPPGLQAALYIRPIQFGIGAGLGVQPAPEEALIIYVSPVGPYFKGGFKPIRLCVETAYHRAGPGGVGNVKAGGNYAAGMVAGAAAKAAGFGEVLWLDSSGMLVEEVGAANAFFVKGDTLYTPKFSGTILPGITRDSVIQLARARGLKVVECELSLSFALRAEEVFCTGTAAVICPVGEIEHKGDLHIFNNNEVGPLTQELYDALTAIQEGREAPVLANFDAAAIARFRQEWIHVVKPA
ncbi:branched-chain amino acid aminotransferase [Candidatus Saganbacteria bacterium]|nr:branched-chain amino acid aminotransferase [Candidatus Saganbacteria bacterium]